MAEIKNDGARPVVVGLDMGGADMTGVAIVARGVVGPVTLTIGLDDQSYSGFSQALKALAEALTVIVSANALPNSFAETIEMLLDGGGEGLFDFGKGGVGGRGDRGAVGASRATIRFNPSERFREFVAAVARQLDIEIVDVHGWPVLTLVGEKSNVTDAGGCGESMATGGGPA